MQLLSPRAEVRLLLCGGSGLLKHARLQHIALALRSLLVLEMRDVQVGGPGRLAGACLPCPAVLHVPRPCISACSVPRAPAAPRAGSACCPSTPATPSYSTAARWALA